MQKNDIKKIGRFVYWTPRILSILFLLFLALFSLDTFDSCSGFLDCALGLFMHNIPVFVLLAVLIISWKHEIVGGVAFILAGLLYISLLVINAITGQGEWYMLAWSVTIAGPAFLVGILFMMNWYKKKELSKQRKKKRKK
jgi:hypothetical protein